MKKYIIVFVFILSSIHTYSSNNDIIIAKTKSTDCKDAFDIYLLQISNDREFANIIYAVSCTEELGDFTYQCLLKKEETILLIFEEYSSPAGLTKIHYLEIKKGILYSSDFLQEEKIPLLTTIDIRESGFNVLNIDNGNFVQTPLKISWEKEKSKLLKIKEVEILQTIDYQY